MLKKVFLPSLLLASLTLPAQPKNDPQLAASDVYRESVTWKKILKEDDTRLRQIGLVAAPRRGTAENPFWSVGCECLDRDYAVFSSYKKYLPDLGAGYGRLQSGWAKCEKVKGRYDFAWLDEHVDGLIEEGLSPWICLCYGNPLYSDSGTMLFSSLISTPDALDAWERYVEALVLRYKGKVTMYEVWNEPNFGKVYRNPKLKETTFNQYNELLFRTIRAIRKHDKTVAIAGGSLASVLGTEFPLRFLSFLKDRGVEREMKYITFHPYTKSNPETRLDEIAVLKDSLSKVAPWIQLLQGEVGIRGASDPFRNDFSSTEYSQAKWTLRQMAMEFGLGIPCSVFAVTDNRYPQKLQSFGLLAGDLMGRVIYKRPQFHAFAHMTSVIDKDVVSGPCLNVTFRSDRPLYCVSLKKNAAVTGAMLWFGDGPSQALGKEEFEVIIEGLNLKDPVYVDMLTGRVFEPGTFRRTSSGMAFDKLPLWDSPVAILESGSFLWDKTETGPAVAQKAAAHKPVPGFTSISSERLVRK